MKGFYKINKSLNNEDLTNKKISFIDFIKKNLYYNKYNNNDSLRKNKNELFEDF